MIKSIVVLTFSIMIISFCTGKISPYSDNSDKPFIKDGKIDIDKNGIYDVKLTKDSIKISNFYEELFKLVPLNDTQTLQSRRILGVEIYHVGDVILSKAKPPIYWADSTLILAWKILPDSTRWRGNWAGQRGYLPLKIKIGSEYHCSWIEMKIDTVEEKFKVFEVYHNPIPDQDLVIKDP